MSNGYYELSPTRMHFLLWLNTSYSGILTRGAEAAFLSDMRDAVALAFQVGMGGSGGQWRLGPAAASPQARGRVP